MIKIKTQTFNNLLKYKNICKYTHYILDCEDCYLDCENCNPDYRFNGFDYYINNDNGYVYTYYDESHCLRYKNFDEYYKKAILPCIN